MFLMVVVLQLALLWMVSRRVWPHAPRMGCMTSGVVVLGIVANVLYFLLVKAWGLFDLGAYLPPMAAMFAEILGVVPPSLAVSVLGVVCVGLSASLLSIRVLRARVRRPA